VQGLANFAQKFMSVLCKPGSTQPFAYFIARGWTVPDYYNYALIARIPSLTWPDRYFLRNGAYWLEIISAYFFFGVALIDKHRYGENSGLATRDYSHTLIIHTSVRILCC